MSDVGFTGRGCAISQASASLLTDEIKGKPVADVAGFAATDLLDLLGIEISPARLKCAMLSFDSLQHLLDEVGAKPLSRRRPADGPLRLSPAGLSRHLPSPGRRRPHARRDLPRPARRPPEHLPPMPKTYAELLRSARDEIPEISPAETDALRQRGGVALIDVREASEWDQGHVPGATHVSKSYIEQDIEAAAPDRDGPVVLYCAGGIRSLFAAQTLAGMGYTDVASMKGGFQAWKGQGLELDPARPPDRGAEDPLQPPPADPRGGLGRPGEAARVEGAADRRRRPRPPGRAVPRGRGRRHARDHRLRRRRPLEPPAPGHPHHRPHRREEGRVRAQDADGAQPGRERGRPRGDAGRRQRRPDHRGLRRRPRRDRHVRDPLHPQRRRGRRRDPGGPRVGVPVRGPAHRPSSRTRVRATAACTRPRPRPSSPPAARSPACWASCPGSWACSRPTRSSSCCWGSARPWPAGCCCSMPSRPSSPSSASVATRSARSARTRPNHACDRTAESRPLTTFLGSGGSESERQKGADYEAVDSHETVKANAELKAP